MATRYCYAASLQNDQLRAHLANKDTLVFDYRAGSWQQIEKQIERLGFGESYIVAVLIGRRGRFTKVTPVETAQRLVA